MLSILKHGVKLTFANFLGILLNFVLTFLATIGFYLAIALVVFGTLGAVSGIQFFTDFDFDLNQFDAVAGSIVSIPIIIIFVLYMIVLTILQSMLIGGLYGSTIESVFENRSSIGTYFVYSFRNLWRLTGLQFAILLLGIPVFAVMFFGNLLFAQVFGEEYIVIPIVLSVIIGLLFFTLFLHSPIFIVRLRVKVWRSIGLAFRLLMENPFRVLLSGVIFFGTILLIHALYLLFVGLPALIGYYLLEGMISTGLLNLLFGTYVFVISLIWGLCISPFSGVMSMLLLIRHYRQHLHPLIEPMEIDDNLYQGPLYQMKRN